MGEMREHQEYPRKSPRGAGSVTRAVRRWFSLSDSAQSPDEGPVTAPLASGREQSLTESTPVSDRWDSPTEESGEPILLIENLRASNARLREQVRVLEESSAAAESKRDSAVERMQETISALKSSKDGLQERNRILKDAVAAVRKENKVLRDHLDALKVRIETLKERRKQADERIEAARSHRDVLVARNQEIRNQIIATRELAAERREKLVNSLSVTRDRLMTKSMLWDAARKYFALFRQGLLYDEIEKSDVDLRADTYLCLLPSTVPAAMALSKKYGGRVICDCVENVEVHRHSLAPNLHPPTLEMVNLGAYGALTAVDGIMTVSNAVAQTLTRFGPPVRLQPNYRRFEEPSPAGDLRARVGIGSDTTILITTGNVVKGFETVLDAIALLPENVHLVALVKLSPQSYDAEVRNYISTRGLSHRVHLLGFVPYDELASLLADADLGIITLDPDNPNHSVALPNRVFDFTTAGLPFIVPPLAEIRAFVDEHRCGATTAGVSAEAWVDAINTVLADLPAYRRATQDARNKVTWESLDDGLIDFLGSPKTVTLLGFRDLSRYQRFLRVTDSLTQRGIRVKAAFFSENPSPLKNTEAEFYHFTDRYGTGPGLQRVPNEGS